MQYIKRFKIKCGKEKDSKFYNVYIFDSFDKMYDYCDKLTTEKISRNYQGLCHGWERIKTDKSNNIIETHPDIGFIALHKNFLGAGVIAHECTHASTYYFKRYVDSKDIYEDADENYAWTIGYLVSQLVGKLYKYGVYEEPKEDIN